MSIRQQHANAYAAVAQLDGAVNEVEQQRLERQGEVYRRLASWTLDALGLASGQRVLEVGCGSGSLLLAAAARVGPTGRVVGIDRDSRLVDAARAKVAHLPWVEVVQADGLAYQPPVPFDAVHCRLVLMHQHAPAVFLAHLVSLARPGGRVAAQEYDADGLPCFPAFAAFERMIDAGLEAIQHVGADFQAGRKLLDRFQRAGLRDVLVEAEAPYVPFLDARLEVMLDGFAVVGGLAERAGAMLTAEYEALVGKVRAAHWDPSYANHLVRLPSLVAAVGTWPGVARDCAQGRRSRCDLAPLEVP
jgi:SAM-dependent methyltransferase